jgi:ferredoxin
MGVRPERIRFESFGPGTVLRPQAPATPVQAGAAEAREARVRFGKTGIDAQWASSKGTLLDLAGAAGLSPAFGCRSGICGTCRTKIREGAVEYLEEPLAARGEDEVLLCCSVPRQAPGHRADSLEPDVIVDL